MASSSSNATVQVKICDVFLSFRGEDTRNKFTSHLRGALRRKSIKVFIDNEELKRGDEIKPSLLKAIEESKISVIVFSKDYATSRWCLDELVKILECKDNFGQDVLPIFYDVDPSNVRNQTGHFKEAFVGHEVRFKDKVPIWKKALTEAANLKGDHFDDTKSEYEFTEKIAEDVLKRLNRMSPGENKDLVGIESKIAELEWRLHIESSKDVRIVGIWGMGGIGKTTLAYAIFNKIKSKFDKACFLYVEKDREPIHLQNQFLSRILEDEGCDFESSFSKDRLSRKKVLVVFDDVTTASQIEKFTRDPKCFGSGSRVIITARDKQLLSYYGVDDCNIYRVEGLYSSKALQLFSQHAFSRQNFPKAEYMELADKVVEYAKGLPLALKVLGSSLFGKKKEHWESQINKLVKIPHQDILKVLKVTYDGLDPNQKSIFLDVACFFKREEINVVTQILDACGMNSKSDIKILNDKCLISSESFINMHDLLQEMSWEIIRQESIKDPGKRSRLWHQEDIYHMLTRNTGTAIEGIRLDMSKLQKIDLNCHTFAKMYDLRIFDFCCSHAELEINNWQFSYGLHVKGLHDKHSCNKENHNKVQASQGLEFVSRKLVYFRWEGYPLKSLPSGFCPNNLVALVMPHSKVEKLWKGIQPLDKLQHINLSHSEHLTEIPDLSQAPNLANLILEGCKNLIEISSSIKDLNKLALLDLRDCESVSHLPSRISSKRLKFTYLSGCSNICTTPSFPCNMKYLDLSGTAISEFPMIEDPSKLYELRLSNCLRLKGIVLHSVSGLSSLVSLDLSGCGFTELPDCFGQLISLKVLFLDKNNFEKIPAVIRNLSRLSFLGLSDCKRLQSLLELQSDGELVIDLHDCVELVDLQVLSWSWTYSINFANCNQLDQNALGNKMKDDVLRYQEGLHGIRKGHIFFPGNEIPEWFGFKETGSAMKIKLPPDWYNEKFRGFALCVVVGFPDQKTRQGFGVSCYSNIKSKNGGGTHCHDVRFAAWPGADDEDYYLDMQQDHVFLGFDDWRSPYASREFEEERVDSSEDNEANIQFDADEFGELDIDHDRMYEVKKCGIYLVYGPESWESVEESSTSLNSNGTEEQEEPIKKSSTSFNKCEVQSTNYQSSGFTKLRRPTYEKEVEGFNQCTNQSSNLSSLDLNEFPQDFVGTTMDDTTTKLSLAAYDGAELSKIGCCDGQSSSCSLLDLNEFPQDSVGSTMDVIATTKRSRAEHSENVCDEDEPQHKRVKEYKFF